MSATESDHLHVFISTFTVAGVAVGVMLVIGAMRMRERNKHARHSLLEAASGQAEENIDQETLRLANETINDDLDNEDTSEQINNEDETGDCVVDGMVKLPDSEIL